jgi:hypothetical protein
MVKHARKVRGIPMPTANGLATSLQAWKAQIHMDQGDELFVNQMRKTGQGLLRRRDKAARKRPRHSHIREAKITQPHLILAFQHRQSPFMISISIWIVSLIVTRFNPFLV